MKTKTSIKLPLTEFEKARLKQNKLKISEITDFAVDELEVLLSTSFERARELHALAEFQTVPSIGIRFAEDLVFMGYYALNELKDKDGAALTDAYEQKRDIGSIRVWKTSLGWRCTTPTLATQPKTGGILPTNGKSTALNRATQQPGPKTRGTNQLKNSS